MSTTTETTYSPRVKLLTLADLKAAGIGERSTIYEWVSKGLFPKPVMPGKWRESAIIAWLDRREGKKA